MRIMSSTHRRGAVVARRTVLACVLFAWCPCAFALNPALDVSQYAHTAWKFREGFSTGRIHAITQTPDGYLWLGTDFGLLRFDGVRAVPWQPPEGQHLPDNSIRELLAARDGTLWIGTLKGLASWNGGKLTAYPVTWSELTVLNLWRINSPAWRRCAKNSSEFSAWSAAWRTVVRRTARADRSDRCRPDTGW